jgi:hypothetical protein
MEVKLAKVCRWEAEFAIGDVKNKKLGLRYTVRYVISFRELVP